METSIKSRTFGIIKPDAYRRGIWLDMIDYIYAHGFHILEMNHRQLSPIEATFLYEEHQDKDWFKDQISFMLSGRVAILLIETDGPDCVSKFRALMGPTDKKKAEPHTLRARFAIGDVYRENAIHGSDSIETALREIAFFFPEHQ